MSQPPTQSDPPATNPRVVVPIVAGIGNALLAVPMVREIAREIPDVRITVIARTQAMAEPFRRMAEVGEVLVTGSGLKNMLRGVFWSRQRKPDVYVVPFPSNRWQYTLLAMTSGAKCRVLHSYPVGRFATGAFLPATRVPAVRGLHDVEQNLSLVDSVAGTAAHDPSDVVDESATPISATRHNGPAFALNEADRNRATDLLRAASVAEAEAFIAIHAGSAQTILATAKRWPPEKYAELIVEIARETKFRIVLLEGPDEAGVVDEILRFLPAALSRQEIASLKLTGPLGEAGAVLERATLYVGSDSGLAHLAAAVGTPPVTLFAPADPERVCPHGFRHLVVQTPMPCAPCLQYPWNATKPKLKCAEPMCVKKIEVDAVMEKVREGLGEGATPRVTLPVIRGNATGSQAPVTEIGKSTRRYLGLIKWVLFLAVLAFAVKSLWSQFGKIDWSTVHFAPLPLAGGFLCYVAVYVVQMLSYRLLLSAYVKPPSWRGMAAVAWIPPMGKYIPGKIWSITGAIQLLRRFSIPGSIGLSVVLVQDGIANITGLITGSPMLTNARVMEVLPLGWLIGPLVVACGIIALSPPVFGRLINFALLKLKRQPLTKMPDIVHYVGPVLLMFGQWVLAGVGVWLMALSVTQVDVKHIPMFISSAGLAYTVSYLMLFAPAGVGPREIIFNAALLPVLGPTAAIVVVTLRIVQTMVELLMAGLGMVALRLSPSDERANAMNDK